MSIKIATPISHLFGCSDLAGKIIEQSDCLECRQESVNADYPAQYLFHCHLQPIHELGTEDFKYLEQIAEKKPDLKLVTFHAATQCSRPSMDGYMFQPGGRQYSRKEMLENTGKNFRRIRSIWGKRIKIAIENNNYYPTEAYRLITDADFIMDIVRENDIYLLFDIAHAEITARNKKIDYEEYKEQLPLDRIIQLHVCRYAVDKDNIAYDAHAAPTEIQWQQVKNILTCCRPTVEYLTVEYYQDASNLITALKKSREIVDGLS